MGLLPHSSSSNGVLVSFFILPYRKYILTYFYIYISIVTRNGFCYWVRSYDWKRLLVSFLFPPYIKTSWPFGQLISSYFYYSLLIQWDYLESISLLHLLQPDPLRSLFRKCLQVSLRNLCGRTVHHQVIWFPHLPNQAMYRFLWILLVQWCLYFQVQRFQLCNLCSEVQMR